MALCILIERDGTHSAQGFELKHGMTSTKRRCGSFSLGPAGRNADIFDFELSEAEMRSWIEMREMVQTEVVDSACTHTQITHFSETWMTLCLNHRRFQHAPKHFCFNVLWEQFPLRYPHAAELGSFCISQNAKSWFFEVPKTPKVDFLQFGENRKVDFLDSRRPGKSFFPFFLDSLILIATDPNAFPNLGGFFGLFYGQGFLDALPLLAYHFERPAVEDLFSSDLGGLAKHCAVPVHMVEMPTLIWSDLASLSWYFRTFEARTGSWLFWCVCLRMMVPLLSQHSLHLLWRCLCHFKVRSGHAITM